MKADKLFKKANSQVLQYSRNHGRDIIDNRTEFINQATLINSLKKKSINVSLDGGKQLVQLASNNVIQCASHDFSFSVLGGHTRQWIGRRINSAYGAATERSYLHMQNGGEQVWIRLTFISNDVAVSAALQAQGIQIGTIREGHHYLT